MDILSEIRNILLRVKPELDVRSLRDDVKLANVGFNSFDMVQLALFIEDRFNLNLIDEDVTVRSLSSISEIALLLREKYSLVG